MPNRLARESSTYLQQHADNPVDWWPWCDEALALARHSQRPILLSIGYAACHWCHVMAHESFEDPETAAVMNAEFVNIKVDRQSRPDLDHVYQAVHQAMTGRPGGWPLTVFLSADLTPIHAGTYFPRTARFGLPDFVTLLTGVARAARDEGAAISAQGERLRAYFDQRTPPASAEYPADGSAAARDGLLANFDARHGGFGGAPKFPQPTALALLADLGARGDAEAAAAVDATLSAMAGSGLFDHIGGGFFRYCVDAAWTIPHFEKMLYDNALLLPLYADAAARTGRPADIAVCAATVDWLLTDLRASDGLFFAAFDADSEGEEGRYYRWTPEAVRRQVGEADWPLVAAYFGLDQAANFEGVDWHLTARVPLDRLAVRLGRTPDEAAAALPRVRQTLLAARRQRVPPLRDGQCLTAWNALLVSGLAHAARLLARPEWRAAATQTGLILARRALVSGGLPVDLDRDAPGFLDDHAFALAAMLDLIETADPADDAAALDTVVQAGAALATRLVDQFQAADGRFYLTPARHENVLFRPQTIHDQALPAGAAVAISGLATWAAWSGHLTFHDAAARAAAAHAPEAAAYPAAAATFWRAETVLTEGAPTVVLRGPAADLVAWRAVCAAASPAGLRVIAHANESTLRLPFSLHKPPSPEPRAFWCAAGACLPPIDSLEELTKQIETLRRNRK